jgi:tyrosine-protein kinase Etk/Wzc
MKIIQDNMEKRLNPSDAEEKFDPFKFLVKYFKYWPLFLVSVFIFLCIAFYINLIAPPIFQANGKFFIKEDTSNLGILDLTGITKGVGGRMDQKIANEAVFLKSRPVAEKALARLDFNVDYFEPGMFIDREVYKNSPIHVQVDWLHPQIVADRIKISWTGDKNYTISFPGKNYWTYIPGVGGEEIEFDNDVEESHAFGDFTESSLHKIKVTLTKNIPEGEILIMLRTKGSLISEFTGDNFEVYPFDNLASVLGLTLNSSHPQKAADYLNTLMEVYLEMELEEKNRIARNTVEFIDAQISGVSDTLSFFEDNLQAFRSRNLTYNIEEESGTVFKQLTELEAELSRERFNRDYYEGLKSYLLRENFDQIIAPSGIGINDPALNSLISELIKLQSEKSNLLFSQTEASPRVRELTRKILDSSASILEMVRNLSNNSTLKIRELEARTNRLESQFSRLPSTEQNLIKIQRGRNLNESIYNFLQQRRAEAAISMASNFSSNKIVEYAYASSKPKKNKRNVIYVLFAGIGFILPVAFLIFKDVVDKRIKDPKELEASLAIPLLAKIPQNMLGTSLAVLDEPRSAIAESFRALKTNISFVVPLERQLTIAVSSTLSGEGKTFTAINLASIYALNNKKTILISCDMFKPYSFKDFELKSKVGLSNYLSQQVDSVFEIIQNTKFSSFDIILAGAIPPNPSDLLSSPRFIQLLDELKKVYDVIVLDTPPVGLISQSFEVIKHVDLLTYVLRYNFSEKSFVEDLNDIKTKKGIQNIYAVLNAVPAKELTYKGFNYGYYEEKKKKKNFLGKVIGRDKAAL